MDEVLSRVRATIASRRAGGAVIAPPQALVPVEADEVEALEFYPWRRALASRREVDIRDLVEAARDVCVARCYRILLRRDPTPDEALRGDRLLSGGWSPLVLVAQLRWSAEGRTAGVHVPGMASRLLPAVALSLVRAVVPALRKAP